jgi:hypothetical protein
MGCPGAQPTSKSIDALEAGSSPGLKGVPAVGDALYEPGCVPISTASPVEDVCHVARCSAESLQKNNDGYECVECTKEPDGLEAPGSPYTKFACKRQFSGEWLHACDFPQFRALAYEVWCRHRATQ